MKVFNTWLAAAALTTASFSATTHAQTPYQDFLARSEVQQFNTSVMTLPAVTPPGIQMMMGKPATTISLDVNALFSLPDFQLELPGLENFHAVKEKIIENSLGGDNWIGDVVFVDPTGYATGVQGRAYFVESDSGITGTIHTADSVIQIYPDGAGGQVVVTEDPSYFDNEEVVTAADGGEGGAAASPAVGGRRDGPNVATVANPYTIDVLWVTTQLARDSGADMEALIELATTTGNDVLVNSEVPAQMRVVGIHHNTTYSENSGDMGATLYALRNTNDGHIDEIHQMRSDLGADMVAAVSGATNYCGIAFIDSTYDHAFSVNGRNCMSSYTPIHEFGHNFGAHHDTANGYNDLYTFGYGLYNNTDDPYWRTVMSYQCPAGANGGCPRIAYFSNSQQTYNGLPLGDAEAADNARVLRVRMAEVAGFEPSLTTSCTEHTSTNSTHVNEGRAYTDTVYYTTYYYAVGSDEQLSGYSWSTSTLAEEPAGYYTPGNCGTTTTGETQFAPEVQNLVPTPVQVGLRLEGEVFDANADTIVTVRGRETGTSTWTDGSISNGTNFSVDIPAVLGETISVDVQSEDSEGNTFEFTTSFDIEVGEAPTIELSGTQVFDDSVLVSGRSEDPDNSVFEIYYQVDGAGDPDTGTWTLFNVNSDYWTVDVDGLSPGVHTVHLYGADQTQQRSNVISVQTEILAAQAPDCVMGDLTPSQSRVAGQFEISGIMSDVNFSDISIEYRINSGSWEAFSTYSNVKTASQFWIQLPGTYADNSSLTVEMRLTDSTNLQSSCGSKTVTVNYPTQDESPTCDIIDIDQYDGLIRFWMTVNDPNGDMQSMYAKNSTMTEWIQTWPGPISTHFVPIPGFGEATVNGRVLDATGLEGLCSATITITDSQATPEINNAYGGNNQVTNIASAEANVKDLDGDIVSVEFREVGTSTWLAGAPRQDDPYENYWEIDLGTLPNGDYMYEARATDSGGRVSNIVAFDFNVTAEDAPTIDSLTYTQDGRDITVSGTKSDPNDNDRYVWYKVDAEDWVSIWDNDSNFSFTIIDLADGPHTIEVYVQDSYDHVSASQFINIDIDSGSAPVITNVTYNILSDRVDFTITADDVDGGDLVMYRVYDGQGQGSIFNGSYQWIVSWIDPSIGSHTATFYVLDEFNNQSDTYTVNFDIVDSTPCFEDSNANHESAGRAYIETVGETCYGTYCYGGTDTYFATGSGDDLGTSASATTSLVESSPGYFELGSCSDTTAPVITLSGNNPMDVAQGSTFVEPGFTATDNVDGDITANVSVSGTVDTNTVGTYQLTYSVSDSSGNAATNVIRTVNVVADTVKPVITIPGGLTYEVTLNDSFSNPAAQATDNIDGDISANVVVTGTVDTSTVGTYYLYYNVSDASGNNADEVIVTVDVVDQQTTPCFTDTLGEHVNAGRAEIRYGSSYYTVVPTGQSAQYLGSTYGNTDDIVSLEDIATNHWVTTASCN